MRTTSVERRWHRWRGIGWEVVDNKTRRLKLGWVTLLVWSYDGSLVEVFSKLDTKMRAAIGLAKGDKD